jgi:hypothetical protein
VPSLDRRAKFQHKNNLETFIYVLHDWVWRTDTNKTDAQKRFDYMLKTC